MKNKLTINLAAFLLTIYLLLGKSPLSKFIGNGYDFFSIPFTSMLFISIPIILIIISILGFNCPFFRSKELRISSFLILLSFIFLLLSFIWSKDQDEAENLILPYFSLMLIIFSLFFIRTHSVGFFIKRSMEIKVVICLVIIVCAMVKLSLYGLSSFENNRLSFMGGPNIFIRFCFTVILWVAVFNKNNILKFCLLFLLFIPLVLSGSKAGAVVLFVFLAYLFVFKLNFKFKIYFLIFSVVSVYFIFLYFGSDSIYFKTFERALFISDLNHVSGSTEGRLDNIKYTIDFFFEKPFIGIGISSFLTLTNNWQPYPHNIILESINYGVIYFILFWSAVFIQVKYILNTKSDDLFYLYLKYLTVAMFMFTLFSGDVFYSKDFYISLVFLSLYSYYIRTRT